MIIDKGNADNKATKGATRTAVIILLAIESIILTYF